MKRTIRGLLVDLDGVVYVGDQPIDGARRALETLKEKGVALRFVTNTTTRTATEVVEKLRGLGFDVGPEEVFSALSATQQFLRAQKNGQPKVHLLVRDSVRHEFEEFPQEDEFPDFVVVGDIGAAWSYSLLNRAFRQLLNGAELVAMHRNKYLQTESGLSLDIGAFVAGLEYVAGQQARVIGKPSLDFFRLGLDALGLPANEVAVVGDDIENDVGGGQAAGLWGVLTQTGKYRSDQAAASEIRPDLIIESIAELPERL